MWRLWPTLLCERNRSSRITGLSWRFTDGLRGVGADFGRELEDRQRVIVPLGQKAAQFGLGLGGAGGARQQDPPHLLAPGARIPAESRA